MQPRCLYLYAALLVLLLAGFQLQADEWITECEIEKPAGDCSIIGVVRGTGRTGIKGSFSLAIDLHSAQVAVVGTPYPVKARVRIDKNSVIECAGMRYCLVSPGNSEILIRQLETGSLILLDVSTARDTFLLSMTARGYRAGLAKIRAHRDLVR